MGGVGDGSFLPVLLKEVTGFKSEIVSDVDLEVLESELKPDVLQIVVEALSNARRHGGTSEARLSFLRKGEMLLAEIAHSNPHSVEPFTAVYSKLGVTDRLGLWSFALRNRLIQSSPQDE